MANELLLKNDVILLSKAMLPQIPFNTVYSYADILFDLKEVPFNDPSLKKQVDFLKNTKLSDIEYSNANKPDFFTITNRLTGESIKVSNRMPSRGELRGVNLRSFLDARKKEAPNEVVYDAITSAIRTAEYSDMISMFRGTVSTGEVARLTYGIPMPKEHFQLFVATLLEKIREKIQNKTLQDDLEPQKIRTSGELQEEVLQGIDISGIYDATQVLFGHLQPLTDHFQQIKDKSDELSRRGYIAAAKAAADLYRNLTAKKISLIQGKLSAEDFADDCNQLIEKAQNGELKNHRGFFANIWLGIKTILNFITLGVVSIKPTESIEKTSQMKNAVKGFVDSKSMKDAVKDFLDSSEKGFSGSFSSESRSLDNEEDSDNESLVVSASSFSV